MTSTAFSAVNVRKPDLLAYCSIAVGYKSSNFVVGDLTEPDAGLRPNICFVSFRLLLGRRECEA